MASTHFIAFAVCLGTISAQVVTFDPHLVGKLDFDNDLLLVIEQGKSLGRPSVDKALQKLDEGHAGLTRQRGLEVSLCKDCDAFDKLLAKHRLGKEDLPLAILYPMKTEDSKQGIFRLSLKGVAEPLSALTSFITSIDSGELQAYVKSAPEPTAKEQQAPVRVVVGMSFEKEVADSDKHTVLLIYDEHDASSKKLKSLFQSIGQQVDPKTSPLRVAQFDKGANDFPVTMGFQAPGTPAIVLFRQGDTGDPDYCPEKSMHTVPGVVNWLDEMLPETNYPGMHAFLNKLAQASAIVDSTSGSDLQHFGSQVREM